MKLSEDNLLTVLIDYGLSEAQARDVITKTKEKDAQEKVPREKKPKKGCFITKDQKEDLYFLITKEPVDGQEWGDEEFPDRLQKVRSECLAKYGSAPSSLVSFFEACPAKLLKAHGITLRTKEPVALVPPSPSA